MCVFCVFWTRGYFTHHFLPTCDATPRLYPHYLTKLRLGVQGTSLAQWLLLTLKFHPVELRTQGIDYGRCLVFCFSAVWLTLIWIMSRRAGSPAVRRCADDLLKLCFADSSVGFESVDLSLITSLTMSRHWCVRGGAACSLLYINYLSELRLDVHCIGLAQWLLLTLKLHPFGPRAGGIDYGRSPMFYFEL